MRKIPTKTVKKNKKIFISKISVAKHKKEDVSKVRIFGFSSGGAKCL